MLISCSLSNFIDVFSVMVDLAHNLSAAMIFNWLEKLEKRNLVGVIACLEELIAYYNTRQWCFGMGRVVTSFIRSLSEYLHALRHDDVALGEILKLLWFDAAIATNDKG